VYKAVAKGDMRKARSLQKLILKSQSARFIAIRQVTQLNAGKKTAGVDGKKSLNHKERFELNEVIKANVNNWKHQKLREIPIPKKDGSTRTLKVPTIADRAWQCVAKLTLEPAHEATFHARSYGFRTGRSAHDAQKFLFSNLSSKVNGSTKRVLELDDEILDKIQRFLAERGLNISERKTKLTKTTDGFNFLGWKFIVQQNNGKLRCTPSADNFKAFRTKVKNIVNNSNYVATVKAEKLAPVVRGWCNCATRTGRLEWNTEFPRDFHP
jgi:retron-type reverse transcriptase